jgi:hypothetical protein
LALLVTMIGWGLLVEFHISLLLMFLVTLGILLLLVYFSLLRRLKIGEGRVIWVTPMSRYEIPMHELRHFGIVEFRRFRFAYLSRAEEVPFRDPSAPVISDKDTFVIQFRPKAWNLIETLVKIHHPDLYPKSFSRR